MEIGSVVDLGLVLGFVFGAGVIWHGHRTLADEVKELRRSRHEHAQLLQRVAVVLDSLEKRLERLEARV
jgi:hypothetical protein